MSFGGGAKELAKDVTGMANSRGGLIVVGLAEDDQSCAKQVSPVSVNGKTTEQMENILRSRVVPWLNGTGIRSVELPEAPGTGFYLITVPRSPLPPHAVRSGGHSKPRYCYAHRAGTTTRWLEETEIADAYRNRFTLAQEHSARALSFFHDNPFPRLNQVSATVTWLELAMIPAVAADHRLDTAFIESVQAFLRSFRQIAPVPGIAAGVYPAVARRRVHLDAGISLLDFSTDGSAFITANLAAEREGAPVLWAVMLEYHVLGAVHLAAAYARWAGAYGDVDILARTAGAPAVYLETGDMNWGSHALQTVTRTSDTPTQITVPLDAITENPSELLLAARSVAGDLLADYGHARTALLSGDGSVNYQSLEPGYRGPLRDWLRADQASRQSD